MVSPERPWPVTVRPIHPQRAGDWLRVFGTDTLPVTTPFPHWAAAPGHEGGALFYKLAIDELDEGQRERALQFCRARFGLSEDEARMEMAVNGIPVLAEDLAVTIRDPRRWM